MIDRTTRSVDTIILAKVVTLDRHDTQGEALAIRDGRIWAVGSRDDVLALRGPETRVLDYPDGTVIPGFNDTHAHLDSIGLQGIRTSLAGAGGIDDVLATVAREAAKAAPGTWIVTNPVGQPPFLAAGPQQLRDGRMPTRQELDRAAPDHPVYVCAPSGYWCQPPVYTALNSLALARNGIDRTTRPRAGGLEICVDDAGEPTGIIIDHNYPETALLDLLPAVPRFTVEQRYQAIRRAQALYHAKGTTSIYEGHGMAPIMLGLYRRLREEGTLTMRTGLVINPLLDGIAEAARLFRDWLPYAQGSGLGDDVLRVSGIHLPFGGDPVIAALAKHDPSDISWSGYVKGANSADDFEALALEAARCNLRVHTLGSDQADTVLTSLERIDAQVPLAGRRWVMEHLGPSDDTIIERIRRLGIGVTLIPCHHLWKVGKRYFRLDAAARDFLVPARHLFEAGVPVAAGTDAVPYDPLLNVWAMAARLERSSGTVLGPGGRVPVATALRIMTVNGAWLTFDEHRKGPLAPGYFADLAVLSANPLTVELDALPEIRCLATMVGGRLVHGGP